MLSPRSNRNSLAGPPAVGPSSSGPASLSALAAIDTPVAPAQKLVAEPSTSAGPAPTAPAAPPAATSSARPITKSAAEHSKVREDKARALFAKYGFTLEPGEWSTPATSDLQWVEKKVVMRVHRQCHRCQTSFGADKLCSNCTHTRCKKCPRFPAKRTPEEKALAEKERAERAANTVAVDMDALKASAKSRAIQLTMQNRRTGVEEVRKNPVQRVRRTCHKCQTLFKGRATICENCQHPRCPQCPREP